MRKSRESRSPYPEHIAAALKLLAKRVADEEPNTEAYARLSSLYGLVLSAGYSLCEAYHRLFAQPVTFHDSATYFSAIRLKLHSQLVGLARNGKNKAFRTELVGFHVNTAQHFLHFLLDRLLNVLLPKAFGRTEEGAAKLFYHLPSYRIHLLTSRLGHIAPIGGTLGKLDKAFFRWAEFHQSGNCNDFVKKLLNNSHIVASPTSLRSLLHNVRVCVGSEAHDDAGAVAFIVDRTNEAKHLPDGAGRAKLAFEIDDSEGIMRLYAVEWAITFIAFQQMVPFVRESIDYLAAVEKAKKGRSVNPPRKAPKKRRVGRRP